MQQALIRKYSSPAEFQNDLPQLASDGWSVQRVERSAAPGDVPALLQPRPELVVTYARSQADPPELGAAAEPAPPATSPTRRSLSRRAKGFAGAGIALVIFALVAGMGQRGGSNVAAADQTFTITSVADQQAAQPQPAQQARDPKLVAYTQGLSNLTVNASITYDAVAALAAKPQVGNQAWRTQLSRGINDLKTVDSAIRSLTPPACLSDLHAQLIEAVRRLDKAADQIAGAVGVESTSGVVQSLPAFASANNLLRESAVKLQSARC